MKMADKLYKACFLFAAHNPIGRVDEVDFAHISLLAEIGDVYYMSSGAGLHWEDVKRLSKLCKSVRAEKHVELDFGSWKRILNSLGWNNVLDYDELYLVNNSLIPVGDPKILVDKFRSSSASFFSTMIFDEHYTGPDVHIDDFLENYEVLSESVMMPSFFWGLKNVLFGCEFVQKFFSGVEEQPNRIDFCYKYERGFTRMILRRNIPCCFFHDVVHANVPVYTSKGFDLVKIGFPYVKRKLFHQEFYHIDHLADRVRGLISFAGPEQRGMLVRALRLAGGEAASAVAKGVRVG